MRDVHVLENFTPWGREYADMAKHREFQTFKVETCTFHGISVMPSHGWVPELIHQAFPTAVPTLSFFRRSPLGQVEPHFIHTDSDMGDWSAVLYLNAEPPEGDGTTFWTHDATGAIESHIPHLRSVEGYGSVGWTSRESVPAKFNRMVVFPSSFFHSRSIFENWGDEKEARLTQVTFGTGEIFE